MRTLSSSSLIDLDLDANEDDMLVPQDSRIPTSSRSPGDPMDVDDFASFMEGFKYCSVTKRRSRFAWKNDKLN